MDQSSPTPLLVTETPAEIQAELAQRGIGFEQWPALQELPLEADQAQILNAYANDIARVKRHGGYATVDAIRMTPDHPERVALRSKFLAEHTHAEDEVRFFVEGRGLFCLHLGAEVLLTLCERGDLIRVPAGTKHWFDMGAAPSFTCIRLFTSPDGWVADFTGSDVARNFPRFEEHIS